jgi:Peptide-N-glycosidase F, C terminal
MRIISFIMLFISVNVLVAIDSDWQYENNLLSDQEKAEIILRQHGGKPAPELNDGYCLLVNGWYGRQQNNSMQWNTKSPALYKHLELEVEIGIRQGGEGMGILLLPDTLAINDSIHWESPNFEDVFAVGIDVYNPPTSNFFDEFGNYYGNPEREISLHWNGVEYIKKLSDFEFRQIGDNEESYLWKLSIDYVCGGAQVNLSIDDHLIYDNYFIPGMLPYHFIPLVGAYNGEQTSPVYIGKLQIKAENMISLPEPPMQIPLFAEEVVHTGNRDSEFTVDFSLIPLNIGRVILTLDLATAPGGLDPWDKGGYISLTNETGTFEICRFITPYLKAYQWKVDVTDFLPLFQGIVQGKMHVDTWMETKENPTEQVGWSISTWLDFYPGEMEYIPFKIDNLWTGNFEYGDPEHPMELDFPVLYKPLPPECDQAKVMLMVTGHGMSPNTDIAAEFMPATRTFAVNGHEFESTLWNDDCYLNPCRPQAGTWKFSRAGWAPGSVVMPWEIDITPHISEQDTLRLDYIPMPYRNYGKNPDTYPPHHWVESQIIYYKKR